MQDKLPAMYSGGHWRIQNFGKGVSQYIVEQSICARRKIPRPRLLISRAREHSMIVGGANDLRREAFSSYGTSLRRLQVLLSSSSYFSE